MPDAGNCHLSLADDGTNSADAANRRRRVGRAQAAPGTVCRFVVIGSPRTGSSHLTSLINKHRDILFNSAIFHGNRVWVHWPKEDMTEAALAELAALRKDDPDAFLEKIYATNYGRSAVGFKMFSHHDRNMMAKIVADRSIRKVVLYRKNVLANFSSRLIAREIGRYTFKAGDVRPKRPLVRFDPSEFVAFHDKYVSFYRQIFEGLSAKCQTFLPFAYDEVNDPWLLSNLITFLGADPRAAKFESSTLKQNPADIAARFSNRAEVEEFCRGQRVEHWLQEGETRFASWGDRSSGD